MAADFRTAFTKSVQNVFETMLQLPVEVEPHIRRADAASFDVAATIEMSGDCVGLVRLLMEREPAQRILSLFAGVEATMDSPEFVDALGELASMVSGGAKVMFHGRQVSISVPSVHLGEHDTCMSEAGMPAIVLPCVTDCGRFVLEFALDDRFGASQNTAQPVAACA